MSPLLHRAIRRAPKRMSNPYIDAMTHTMRNMPIKVAAVQMVSTPDVEENFTVARRLIAEAAGQGAQLVLLPEYWPVMGMQDTDKLGLAEALDGGPIQRFMSELAREHKLWLIGGTLPL